VGFKIGKKYRVKPEFYDEFNFDCMAWRGKPKDLVFYVDYVTRDNVMDGLGCCVASSKEFSFCEEVVDDATQPTKDQVNSPNHYLLSPTLEVRDVRKLLLDKMDDESDWNNYQVDCFSRAWEYLTRAAFKNGKEDLLKCQNYLQELIDTM
jgi:hypothetical protein